jgi:hypothetical protein
MIDPCPRAMTEIARVPGGFRFSHALVRETLYGDLPAAALTRLHRRIGELLESLPSSARTKLRGGLHSLTSPWRLPAWARARARSITS